MLLQYTVPDHFDGCTLHDVLRRGLSLSATLCAQVKKLPGGLLVDGSAMYANQRVHAGMCVTCTLPPEIPYPIDADIRPDIRYEDGALLCLNKPAGLVCHPTRGLAPGEDTLLAQASAYLGYIPHLIHRIDRGTTGLVLFAKHAYVHSRMQESPITKRYEALVHHMPVPQTGKIDLPIFTDPTTARREVDARGQRALTHYTLLHHADNLSHLSLFLQTGRTHQLRVHMLEIRCPILGDALYCTEESAAFSRAHGLTHQQLHAAQLLFTHPLSGDQIDICCPPKFDIRR